MALEKCKKEYNTLWIILVQGFCYKKWLNFLMASILEIFFLVAESSLKLIA